MKIQGYIFLIIVVLFVNSCGNVSQTSTQTPVIPTKTFIPTVTPIITPEPIDVKLYKPKNIYDPKDPSLPELIISDNGNIKLDENWQVSQIEYSYDWWGLSEPQLGYELIKQTNSGYQWNGKPLSPEKIQDFVSSINNLHPVQSLLIGIFHTDDYPTWQVELTGTDGNRILIYAASNENPGYGPWHVIYNGRIYAQYDGSIGLAIGKLFDREDDEFAWKTRYPENHPDGLVGFATSGWTNQLWYGFEGLLPIAQGFNYHVDPENSQIQGYIVGRYSIGGFGNMIVGKIVSLYSVKIEIDGKQQSCKIETVESYDEYSARWFFSCNVSEKKKDEQYRIPVRIELGLDSEKHLVTEGTLYGKWGSLENFWVIPPAEEIQKAINANSDVKELMKYTTIYVSKYSGKMELKKDSSPTLSGQFTFIGEAQIEGVRIKYSVFVPFILENQEFKLFDLSTEKLKQFLYEVFSSPITRRMLVYDPNTTINLWYFEKNNIVRPEMPDLWNSSIWGLESSISIKKCGNILSKEYPLSNEPLKTFTFNSDYLWYPWRGGFNDIVSFMIIEDTTIVTGIGLSWWGSPDGELSEQWKLLLPSQINIFDTLPLYQIGYSASEMGLSALPRSDATEEELVKFKNSLSLFPVPVERQDKAFVLSNMALIVDYDGTIKAIPCK